jgi:hypothetical protein
MADSRDNILATTTTITEDIRNRAVARMARFIYGAVQGKSSDETNPFATGTFTEQIDGTGERELYLSHWPITDISSIKDKTGTDLGLVKGTRGTASSTANYWIVDSIAHGKYYGHLEKASGVWTLGRLNYIVAYTAGFDLENYVPQELKDAAEIIAKDILIRDDAPDMNQVRVGQIAYTYAERNGVSIPQTAADLLRPFCRYRK